MSETIYPPNPRSCAGCDFSDIAMLVIIGEGETPHRICRRYPPTMVAAQQDNNEIRPERVHTIVHDDDWCGEFKPKLPDHIMLVERCEECLFNANGRSRCRLDKYHPGDHVFIKED